MTKVVKVHDSNYKIAVGSDAAAGKITLDTYSGQVVIKGDLVVVGNQTSVESQSLAIKDNIIRLNQGETGNGVTVAGLPGSKGTAGVEISRGTAPDVSILWNEVASSFDTNTNTAVEGAFTFVNSSSALVPLQTSSIGSPEGNLTVSLSGTSALVVASTDPNFKYHESVLDYSKLQEVYSISSVRRTLDRAIITLQQTHNIVAGQLIDIDCYTFPEISGKFVSVLEVLGETSFSIASVGADIATTVATGIASPNPIKNVNAIPNFQAVADYMTARDNISLPDRISSADTQVKTWKDDLSSGILFDVNGNRRVNITDAGLTVDNVRIKGDSISNYSTNTLKVDSVLGIVNTEEDPLPTTGYTSLYSREHVGRSGTGLYFVTTTGVRDELLSRNTLEARLDSFIPSPPAFPGNQQLSILTAVERRIASNFVQPDNTNNAASVEPGTVALVTYSSSYQTNTITNVGPGTYGEVVAIKNKVAAGFHIMTSEQDAVTGIGTDAGTYGELIISNDRDYFLTGDTPFKGARQVFDLSLAGTVSQGWNEVRAYSTAENASSTNTVRWYSDISLTSGPVISNLTLTNNNPALAYSSTVPHYINETILNVNFDVSKLSGDTYPLSDTFITGSAGGAFNAPSSVTYQQAGIATPLERNLYVDSGSASITTLVTFKSGANASSDGFSVTVDNGYDTTTATLNLGGAVLYKSGPDVQLDEAAIQVNSVGAGEGPGARIINPGDTDTPVVSSTEHFDSQLSVLTNTDATVVGAVLQHDVTNYQTYYPPGPNLNILEREGPQYFTFKFTRSAVSKFDIKYSGTLAGLWIALPGSDIDLTSSLNGWLDASIPYAGSGIPGENEGVIETNTVYNTAINFFNSDGNAVAASDSAHYFFNTDSIAPISKSTYTPTPGDITLVGPFGNGSNGCAINGPALLNVVQTNKQVTVTFGPVSSASTLTNEILVRVKLSAGQFLTALTIEPASN